MWSMVSIINRFFQQAFITGSFYLVVQINFGVSKWLFLVVLFYFSILNEVYEYKVKTRNSIGDWYVGIKDMSVSLFALLFILWIIQHANVFDDVRKGIVLLVFIGILHILNYVLEKLLEPSRVDHWNLEHALDVISNVLGPIIATPVLMKIMF